jgi:hypothetical protein
MNQPSVNSNLVHLALFFRIAELFPQDDASVEGYGKIQETNSMQEEIWQK